MASPNQASFQSASPAAFGTWLRERREAKGAIQRALAAAADMDSSHLGKIERGERLPTAEQLLSFARFLSLDLADLRLRVAAARLWEECDGDPALAHATAGFVQEAAASCLVNKPANKLRAKK